jgi:hypothetical protein
VQPSQSGTTIRCGRCGDQVQVPRLSKLREIAGKAPFEAGTIDAIHGMLRRGELPAVGRCAVSGMDTRDILDLYVEAERLHRSRDNRFYATLGLLVSPILLLGLLQKPRPDVGRETNVHTPLCVAAEHQGKVRRAGQGALRRWLCGVPIYDRLLKEYPGARIKVGTPP